MAKKMGMKHEMKSEGKSAKDSWGTISMDKGMDMEKMKAKCDMEDMMKAKEVMDSPERMKAAMDYAKKESKKISSIADLKSAMMEASDESPEEEAKEDEKEKPKKEKMRMKM